MITINTKHLLIKPSIPNAIKKKIKKAPDFAAHRPDISQINKIAAKYKKYKNIIIIANGGSRNTAQAFYNASRECVKKKVFFLGTSEPDLIACLKKKCRPADTLVMPISKSGGNINMLEPLMFFLNYPMLVITGEKPSALRGIAEELGVETVVHPNISGRFSGRTTCALLPAAIMGLDISKINSGANKFYKICLKANNPTLNLASAIWNLEKKGYTEIYNPVYSSRLAAFLPLEVQFLHETIGKKEKGLTMFGGLAPEAHHHTNQRFFGGRKNIIGLFTVVEHQDNEKMAIRVPKKIKDIPFKNKTLGTLNGLNAQKSLYSDFKGTAKHAWEKKIPHAVISVDKITEESIGEYLAFLQYFNYYSALLRGMNPFDQPEVERAKIISFALRVK